jgi:hypothetical protein
LAGPSPQQLALTEMGPEVVDYETSSAVAPPQVASSAS